MRRGYTHICFVLSSYWDTRKYIGEMKEALIQFAETRSQALRKGEKILVDGYKCARGIERMFHSLPLADLPTHLDGLKATPGNYNFRDAVCAAIAEFDEYNSSLPEEERPENVMFALVNSGKDGDEPPESQSGPYELMRQTKSRARVDGWEFFVASPALRGFGRVLFGKSDGDYYSDVLPTHNLLQFRKGSYEFGENLRACLDYGMTTFRNRAKSRAADAYFSHNIGSKPAEPNAIPRIKMEEFPADSPFSSNGIEPFAMEKTEESVWHWISEFCKKTGPVDPTLLKELEEKIQEAFYCGKRLWSRGAADRDEKTETPRNAKHLDKTVDILSEKSEILEGQIAETLRKYLKGLATREEIDDLKEEIAQALVKFGGEKRDAKKDFDYDESVIKEAEKEEDRKEYEQIAEPPAGPVARCAGEIRAVLDKYEPLRNFIPGLGYEDDEEVMLQRERDVRAILDKYESFEPTLEDLARQAEQDRARAGVEKKLKALREIRAEESRKRLQKHNAEQLKFLLHLGIWDHVRKFCAKRGVVGEGLSNLLKGKLAAAFLKNYRETQKAVDDYYDEAMKDEDWFRYLKDRFAEFQDARRADKDSDAGGDVDADDETVPEWNKLLQSDFDRDLLIALFDVDDDYLDDLEAFRQVMLAELEKEDENDDEDGDDENQSWYGRDVEEDETDGERADADEYGSDSSLGDPNVDVKRDNITGRWDDDARES